QRETVAAELQELGGARDRGCEQRRERDQFVLRQHAAEVVQAVKAERLADRIRGLEGELVGELLGTENDAVFLFQQGPKNATDRFVLGPGEHDARILQGGE